MERQASLLREDQGLLLLAADAAHEAVGFQDRALGKNELHAKQEAIRLSAEWDRHRFGEPVARTS